MSTRKIIFATNNRHKIEEANAALGGAFSIVTLGEVGITEDIVEDGDTLEENARIKAMYVHDRLDLEVFAEDTGLEVDALDGAPGVITARYAGDEKDPIKNMQLLLENLKNHEDRSAQFRAVISYIRDGKEIQVEGIVRGTIAHNIAEKGGFGYDPIFIPEGYDKTFAELPPEVKIGMSHRTRALSKMITHL